MEIDTFTKDELVGHMADTSFPVFWNPISTRLEKNGAYHPPEINKIRTNLKKIYTKGCWGYLLGSVGNPYGNDESPSKRDAYSAGYQDTSNFIQMNAIRQTPIRIVEV